MADTPEAPKPWTDEELDKIPDEQLAKMRSGYGTQQGLGRAATSGFGEGVVGLVTAPTTLADYALGGIGPNLPGGWDKTAEKLKSKVEPYTFENQIKNIEEDPKQGPFYKPQNLSEGLVHSAASFAPGALAGGVGEIASAPSLGAAALRAGSTFGRMGLASAGSELAARAGGEGEPWEPWMRMAGALGGYNVPGAARRLSGAETALHGTGGVLGAGAAAIPHYLGMAHGSPVEQMILGGILGPEVVHAARSLAREPLQTAKGIAKPAAMFAGTPLYGNALSPPEGVRKKDE